MVEPVVFLDGKYLPLSDAKVGIMTHALHYGTGAFEGIRGNWNADDNKMYIFRLREHYERMLTGAKLLWMNVPYSLDELCQITVEVIERSGFTQDVYICPMAYKGEEGVANLNLRALKDSFMCLAIPFGNYIEAEGALKCEVASWRRVDDTMIPPRFKLAGIYLNSILAKTDALARGFAEAIMLNQDGHVCEGTGENIFFVRGNSVATPSLESNVLPGITRAHRHGTAPDRAGHAGGGAAGGPERALHVGRGVPHRHGRPHSGRGPCGPPAGGQRRHWPGDAATARPLFRHRSREEPQVPALQHHRVAACGRAVDGA